MLTREQCREADQIAITRFGIPGIVLMENAGSNCASELLAFDNLSSHDSERWKTAVVLCGPGNNGGDGFVIARHLSLAGWKTKVILFGRPEDYSGDALTNLNSISRFKIPTIEVDPMWPESHFACLLSKVRRFPTDWVIDALLGTGATGEPRGPMETVIRVANKMDVGRAAVDIPTGLDCNTGSPAVVSFHADLTCTFIDQKTGFANPEAVACLGIVKVIGIGAPV